MHNIRASSSPIINSNNRDFLTLTCHSISFGGKNPTLIERIVDWINGIDYPTRKTLVDWLYSSSKAHSAATYGIDCRNAGIQTLAYELATRLPQQFCEQLLQSVDDDPRIFSRSLDFQVRKLILEPLGHTALAGGR